MKNTASEIFLPPSLAYVDFFDVFKYKVSSRRHLLWRT